jgi:hypothetical protein
MSGRRIITPGRMLRLSAVYLGAIGLISFAFPRQASTGLGQELTAFDTFAARTIGLALVTIAIVNWSAGAESARNVVLANIFLNASLAALDTVGILDGTIGSGSWTGITIHLILLTGLLACLERRNRVVV